MTRATKPRVPDNGLILFNTVPESNKRTALLVAALHCHHVKYLAGSKQQQVTCYHGSNDNDYWADDELDWPDEHEWPARSPEVYGRYTPRPADRYQRRMDTNA